MDVVTLGGRTLLATLLLVAGAAKLSDVPSFTVTVRQFLPGPARRRARPFAFGVIIGELIVGAVALALPGSRWTTDAVFAVTCLFLGVSVAGYLFFRNRPCRCFGALSTRKFDAMGVVRGVVLVAIGALSLRHVPVSATRVGTISAVLLLAVAAILAVAAYAAASAVAATRRSFGGAALK